MTWPLFPILARSSYRDWPPAVTRCCGRPCWTSLPRPWTLIGGQMVYLHGVLVGRSPHRFTEDIDVVFDMRVEVDAITKAHRALDRLGYEVAGVSADGLAYRYRNGSGVEVDILAPDHLGERALPKLHTPYGKTVQMPGARTALQHSCTVTATSEPDHATWTTSRSWCRWSMTRTLLSDPVYKSLPLGAADPLDDAAHASWRKLGEHAEDGVAAWTMLREG